MIQLEQIYMVSAAIGFVYVTVGAFLGQLGGSDGHHMDAGHHIDHGGHVGNGHSAHSHSDHSDHNLQTTGKNMQTGLSNTLHQGDTRVLSVLKFISPMTIAIFCFWFGIFGYGILHYIPILGYFSLVLSLPLAIIGTKIVRSMFSLLLRRVHSSTSFREEQLIGSSAEVTVSIPPGRLGEITYVINGARHTAASKSTNANQGISTNTKVIIIDIVDGILYVEPWRESID
jgi:membrane protein implicated in regulation of membrane protease activity